MSYKYTNTIILISVLIVSIKRYSCFNLNNERVIEDVTNVNENLIEHSKVYIV